MHPILFDDHSWENLLPLTFTRPVSKLRVGILTIAEKWEKILGMPSAALTRDHLMGLFPLIAGEDNLLINGALLPNDPLVASLGSLRQGDALKKNGKLLGVRTDEKPEGLELQQWLDGWQEKATEYAAEVSIVDYPWKIFSLNGEEIFRDYALLTLGKESETLSGTVHVIGDGGVFVEPGFRGEHITLNTEKGPVYLGRNSLIMEGSLIRGPFALGDEAVVKMGARIYGPTTIGPFGKVGGEINHSVFLANSNKAHDGYMGHSVIGEWCNLGAGTNNSNLKNNYSEVKMWNYAAEEMIGTGLQFCGVVMGDHSKCAINTMFNTGTVVGVSANLFGPGFPPAFVPSFSWGGSGGFTTYKLDKALETAALVLSRREQELTGEEKSVLEYVYRYSEPLRQKATEVNKEAE